jgi:catechol 2,3-dioxygenase-like lactoylglutathione lyase family enzyme
LVSEFDACLRFYRDVLGLELNWGEEGGGYASFHAGDGILLALFGRQEMAAAIGSADAPFGAAGPERAMLIFEVPDLEAAVARLKDKGVAFLGDIQERRDWGIRVAFLRDPNGTLIELNSPLPKEVWTEQLQQEDDRYSGEV